MKAFIFAAGFGTRMGHYTTDCPKPLLKVNNHALLTYTLFQLYRWKIKDVIINTHYLADKISAHIEKLQFFNFTISYEPDILETGGALRKVFGPDQSESLVILNPDVIFFSSLEDQPQPLQKNILSHLFIAPKNKVTSNEPGWSLESDTLTFDKSGNYYYIGYCVLSTRLTENHKIDSPFKLGPIWKAASLQNQISGNLFQGKFYDVGSKVLYEEIKDQNIIPSELEIEWNKFLEDVYT